MRTASSSLLVAVLALTACKTEYDLTGERPDVDPGEVTECDFTGLSGTRISVYDCNPVFTTTDEPWAADIGSVAFHTTEVLGHPFYQIWYLGYPANGTGDQYSLGYAVSGSGTNWDPNPANPLLASEGGSTWDRDYMAGMQVVWDDVGSRYVMSYQGGYYGDGITTSSDFALGVATSPDGVAWTRHPNNPIINVDPDPVTFAGGECWPLSLTASGGAFRSYVAMSDPTYDYFNDYLDGGCDDIIGSGVGRQCVGSCDVYVATATDLSSWQLGTAPVLRGTEWYEAKGVVSAAVAQLDDTLYMFYISFEDWAVAGGDVVTVNNLHFAMATSNDGGLTWIKDPSNPIDSVAVTPEAFQTYNVGAQTVGRRIHFWLTDVYPSGSGVGYFILEPDLEAAHP